MKRLSTLLILFFLTFFIWIKPALSQETDPALTPIPSTTTPNYRIMNCPDWIDDIYEYQVSKKFTTEKERCVTSYAEFMSNPYTNHLWVEDQEITSQGKSNDRARQFIFWVMSNSAIDNHPGLIKVWSTARNLAYFFTILMAAILGLTIIIGQRTNFSTGVKIWPSITKVALSLLYISFSATLVILIIQMSEILMKFFIENLGGKDLFNIYFSGVSQEKNYIGFIGYRDLNYRVQEAIKTELFLFKLTNISYYLLGGMFLLRKIILWFLLFVSPFLAIIMSFSLIKNVGWVWIGVFFQWVFYGPLAALFLGALATIWKNGIPFLFDFSRAGTIEGYVYPTAITLIYGGPAQKLAGVNAGMNNGNYVDTFTEYIITLIMLWAVTFFPWWLLRIFRDYCCDGINAIKNMMLSNLNPKPNPTPPIPSTPNLNSNLGMSMNIPNTTEMKSHIKLETVEEIKKAKTEEIVHSLDVHASKITDVANYETNKTVNQTVNKNINSLKNPTQASTSSDRLRYMNIRTELANRAAHADPVARQFISAITANRFSRGEQFSKILQSIPKTIATTQVVSIKVKLPIAKVEQITNSVTNYVVTNSTLITTIANKVKLSEEKVQDIINLVNKKMADAPQEMIKKIAEETKVNESQVLSVLKEYAIAIKTDTTIIDQIAKAQNIEKKEIEQVMAAQAPMISEPEKNIEQTIVIPDTVSIDEYEQVKKMWINHYEKGEIPVTENVKTRETWVDQDITLITNTLNKLLSNDENLKQQGLDEVGFILPLFTINNLNGEQLITYLKAKIEAAKYVKEMANKEKEITEKLKNQSEENQVSINLPKKKQAVKTMEMKEELELS